MSSSLEESVKDRLKNIARKTGKDFNFVCIQYMQERFLARLEKSRYRDNFILKGALLLLAYDIPVVRPSKDIDLLGTKTSNEVADICAAIETIAGINLEDGVRFFPNEIDIEAITEDAEYGGLRVKIPATVGGDRQRLQLDIGFGDTIIDGPVDMEYPALLEFPSPNIKVYSLESAIAEKFEAIVSLGMFGSRMKDYFDIWFLTREHEIKKERLRKAILTTFENRSTPVSDSDYIFEESFRKDAEKKQQWKAFLNRNSIDVDQSFIEIVTEIEEYLSPILKDED